MRLRWSPTHEVGVGTLAEVARGRLVFEYDEAFLATGWALSPWKLPAQAGLVEHGDRSFGPLFGVFDDSLPDGWGLLLMDRWFRSRGVDPSTISVLDRLTYLGRRTMGALTYHPPAESEDSPSRLGLAELAAQAEQLLGSEGEVLPELRRAGGSPGGARPKVVVGVRGSQVLSGVDELPDGWTHWLVKFAIGSDGADEGRLEHAYMRMAEAAGIAVPPHRLFAQARFFGVQRFDREGPSNRVHMHTLGGLLHADFRLPSCDYDQLLRVARALTGDARAVTECFRRMVFNVVAHNRDDHAKNFAFLMDAGGQWSLSPAYDLVFARGPGGEHTMTIDGEGKAPTKEGVLRLGARHGIDRASAQAIIEQVEDAVARWRSLARDSGATAKRVKAIGDAHRTLR
ncbi:MAG: type II toxin-antitoxin system HipA family toxin [Deltaproteobacteria bacterium]|nr:type II toxin-antitoxin system HipA family toxin [Deltaproteobacteria bacterium]